MQILLWQLFLSTNIKLLQFHIAHDRHTTVWNDSEHASIFWSYSSKGRVMKKWTRVRKDEEDTCPCKSHVTFNKAQNFSVLFSSRCACVLVEWGPVTCNNLLFFNQWKMNSEKHQCFKFLAKFNVNRTMTGNKLHIIVAFCAQENSSLCWKACMPTVLSGLSTWVMVMKLPCRAFCKQDE